MPDLQAIEARVPVRTARIAEHDAPGEWRQAPIAAWFSGPIFTRARDIFAANVSEILDRAEDPQQMIRVIIMEMEETLIELRSTAARSIADVKELRSAARRLDGVASNWAEKAELALARQRDDLAKAALAERQKAAEMAEALTQEIAALDQLLKGYEADIWRLQTKLGEARARQNAIHARLESAVARARAREALHGSRTQAAFSRFEILERQADFAEARVDALAIGSRTLTEEMAERRAAQAIDAQLAAMKAALAERHSSVQFK